MRCCVGVGGGRRPPPGFPEHISVLQTFGLSPWNSMKRWGSSYLLSLPWKACGEKAVVGGGQFSLYQVCETVFSDIENVVTRQGGGRDG